VKEVPLDIWLCFSSFRIGIPKWRHDCCFLGLLSCLPYSCISVISTTSILPSWCNFIWRILAWGLSLFGWCDLNRLLNDWFVVFSGTTEKRCWSFPLFLYDDFMLFLLEAYKLANLTLQLLYYYLLINNLLRLLFDNTLIQLLVGRHIVNALWNRRRKHIAARGSVCCGSPSFSCANLRVGLCLLMAVIVLHMNELTLLRVSSLIVAQVRARWCCHLSPCFWRWQGMAVIYQTIMLRSLLTQCGDVSSKRRGFGLVYVALMDTSCIQAIFTKGCLCLLKER
jgi:hypothetical protein